MKAILFALAPLLIAGPLCAAQQTDLPTKIVLTAADQRDINERHMLRGRPVTGKVDPHYEELTWDGLRVFTGKKRDAIGWFRTFSMGEAQRMMGFNQHSGVSSKGNYLYGLLCSALAQCGDADVRRAVLWNYQGLNRGYLIDDWKALAKDESLGSADRLLAGIRAYWETRWKNRDSWPQVFWTDFADQVQPEDIVAVELEMKAWNHRGYFTWEVFDPKYADRAKAEELLLALVRREYLGVKKSRAHSSVIEYAFKHLVHYATQSGSTLGTRVVCKLLEMADDKRSGDAWRCAVVYGCDDESAMKLRRLALEARWPGVAGSVFWKFFKTPAGEMEAKQDGGKRFLEEYLNVAFGKKGYQETEEYLRALTGYEGRGRYLMRMLKERRVDVEVDQTRFSVLKRAWETVPEALDFVIVADDK